MREIEASVYATPCQGVADLFGGPAFDTGAGAVGWGAADPRERVLGSRGPPDTLDPTAPPCLGISRAARRGRIIGAHVESLARISRFGL